MPAIEAFMDLASLTIFRIVSNIPFVWRFLSVHSGYSAPGVFGLNWFSRPILIRIQVWYWNRNCLGHLWMPRWEKAASMLLFISILAALRNIDHDILLKSHLTIVLYLPWREVSHSNTGRSCFNSVAIGLWHPSGLHLVSYSMLFNIYMLQLLCEVVRRFGLFCYQWL